MNYFQEVLTAIQEAEAAQRAARVYLDRMLRLCAGNLRGCDSYYLKKMKRELERFDARTGKWK